MNLRQRVKMKIWYSMMNGLNVAKDYEQDGPIKNYKIRALTGPFQIVKMEEEP